MFDDHDPCLQCRNDLDGTVTCVVRTRACHRKALIIEAQHDMLELLEKLSVKVMKAGLAGDLKNWEQQFDDIMVIINKAKELKS